MALQTWSPNTLSWSNAFSSSDLNSLATNGQKTSSLTSPVIDNTITSPATLVMFEFTAGSAFTAATAGHLIVGLAPLLSDNTSYPSSTDGTTVASWIPWMNYPFAIIMLRATSSTEAQRSRPVQIEPGKYQPFLINRSGSTLPASGNMVKYTLFNPAV